MRYSVGETQEEKYVRNPVHFVAAAAVIGVATMMADAPAWGLGYRNPDQDARATGQGEAFVAQADDASAIYYNPAGLTQVKGTQITSGSYIDFPSIHFHPTGGGDVHPSDRVVLLPHFYAASDFGLERWRFGIGANVPFGTSIDWGSSGPLKYLVTRSEMAVFNIEPTAAYQFNEHFSMGAGLNIYQGNTSTEQDLPLSLGGGHFRFTGMAARSERPPVCFGRSISSIRLGWSIGARSKSRSTDRLPSKATRCPGRTAAAARAPRFRFPNRRPSATRSGRCRS